MTEEDREAIRAADDDYEEYEVEEVRLDRTAPGKGDWVCTLEHGFTLRFPRARGNKQPKVGQTARLYGDPEEAEGMRGLVLDTVEVFYLTREEHEAQLKEVEAKMREEAKAQLPELDKRVEVLPSPVRVIAARVRLAQDFDPLGYATVVRNAEQAYYLSLVAQDAFAIEVFGTLPSDSKRASVFRQMLDDEKKRCEEAANGAKLKELEHVAESVDWLNAHYLGEILRMAAELVESEEPLALEESDGVVTVQSADDMLK